MFFASQRKKKFTCVRQRERERDERERERLERERETGGERQSRPVWQDISHIMKMDHGELAKMYNHGDERHKADRQSNSCSARMDQVPTYQG